MKSKNVWTLLSVTVMSMVVILNVPAQTINVSGQTIKPGRVIVHPVHPNPPQPVTTQPMLPAQPQPVLPPQPTLLPQPAPKPTQPVVPIQPVVPAKPVPIQPVVPAQSSPTQPMPIGPEPEPTQTPPAN